MFSATFTSIDFETASRRPDSACQLGLVKVHEGRVVDQHSWLIRPKPFFFQTSNIRIHGITPEQVETEPEFDELWHEIHQIIGNTCLVAHNAAFDMRVLTATLRAHQLPIPDCEYTCTRAIARKTWPHLRRYGLKPLSDWLGIRFQHHDALEDAMACAKLLLAAGIDKETQTLPDLEKKLRLSRGRAGSWGMRGPSGDRKKRGMNYSAEQSHSANHLPFIKPSDLKTSSLTVTNDLEDNAAEKKESTPSMPQLQRLMIRVEFIRPLAGKNVFVTGPFREFDKTTLEELAVKAGAILQNEKNSATDMIVRDNPKTGSVNYSSDDDSAKQMTQLIYSANGFVDFLNGKSTI